jgi:hypothetical protein
MNTTHEAAKLWCPMARLPHLAPVYVMQEDGTPPKASGVAGAFESVAVPGVVRCISSACAMWRWTDPAPERREAKTWWPEEDEPLVEPPRPTDVPVNAKWVPMEGEGDESAGGYWEEPDAVIEAEINETARYRRGYCGLAGRPEVMP